MSALAQFLAEPRALKPRYIIDPVAFFVALIGGPLFFTAGTFWLIIPVFALGFGAIPYLALGTPVLLFHLSRYPARPKVLAGLALLSLFCLSIFLSLSALITDRQSDAGYILFYLVFGIFFAPAWAASFGWVYGKLCRDFYAHPVSI